MTQTQTLQALMQLVGIPSYRALAATAEVSRWHVQQLRDGKIEKMRLAVLIKLAAALQISLVSLLEKFGESAEIAADESVAAGDRAPNIESLKQEYQRLQRQVAQQQEEARSKLQSDALQTLETWLMQWPTIVQRAQANETLSAAKILPFVKPVERLMAEWGVEAIASVDAKIPYDPQYHQLVGGVAEPGSTVQVTHSGCQHQGKLLHRAKVKLL